jgi:4-amino-4-deoxy-L-arabinose transferase-like glycosyltransferase
MRLGSALLGGLTAAFVFLFVCELLPGRRAVALAAALLVAFLPQFGFISGAVNNDVGVNAAAAAALWLAARTLRRGLRWTSAAALGAALAVLPLLKQTGYALYPAVGVAVAVALARRRDRAALVGLGAAGGAYLAVRAAWALTGGAVDPALEPPPGQPAPVVGAGTVAESLRDPTLFASYLWQTFLPRLPFMTDLWIQRWPAFDIYVERGFAAFGWYAVYFPRWVYLVIALILGAVLAVAVATLWRRRALLARRWPEVALVALAIAGVLAAVEAAFVSPVQRPPDLMPEQGRYAFTVLGPFAAIVAWALGGLRPRWSAPVAGALAGSMVVLALASQLLVLRGFYT